MTQYRILPPAREELRNASRWYEQQREGLSHARIDDAGSGHGPSMQANAMPTRGPVISAACRHRRGGFVSSRRRASLHGTTAQSANACRVWANVGRISYLFLFLFGRISLWMQSRLVEFNQAHEVHKKRKTCAPASAKRDEKRT